MSRDTVLVVISGCTIMYQRFDLVIILLCTGFATVS